HLRHRLSISVCAFGHWAVPAQARGVTRTISDVARFAMRKKSSAFAGMCKLKSTKLCTRKPVQPTRPERYSVAANEWLDSLKRRCDSKNNTPRNQAQHRPPRSPVSARASK